jgi:hypothetical protein
MSAKCLNDVDRRLRAYQDQSVEDEVRELCDRYRENLAAFVKLYRDLSHHYDNWREEVFRGVVDYDPGTDSQMKALHEAWLALDTEATKLITVLVGQRCAPGMKVAADYQRCVDEAKVILRDWTPPKLSDDPMLREQVFNREQSRAIREQIGSDW